MSQDTGRSPPSLAGGKDYHRATDAPCLSRLGGAGRSDRGAAGVSAVFGADLSPRLALRAVGEPGAGLGAVAGVVGGGVAEGRLGVGRRASHCRLRPTRDLSAAGNGRGPPSPPLALGPGVPAGTTGGGVTMGPSIG